MQFRSSCHINTEGNLSDLTSSQLIDKDSVKASEQSEGNGRTETAKKLFGSKKISNNVSSACRFFFCDYCDKKFAHSANLRIHERIHTGYRPFVCKFCNKSFSQLCNLRSHERTHTGDRPFVCKVCEKTFTQSQSLRRHERRVHMKFASFVENAVQKS